MDYDEILRQETNNMDKVYLYPLQGMSGWIAFEASAAHLHGLLPNIPTIVKVISIGSIKHEIRAMIVDKLSLDNLLQKVNSADEQTRLVVTRKS